MASIVFLIQMYYTFPLPRSDGIPEISLQRTNLCCPFPCKYKQGLMSNSATINMWERFSHKLVSQHGKDINIKAIIR